MVNKSIVNKVDKIKNKIEKFTLPKINLSRSTNFCSIFQNKSLEIKLTVLTE